MSHNQSQPRLESLTTSSTLSRIAIRAVRVLSGYPHTRSARNDMATKSARVEMLNRMHTIELVDQYAKEYDELYAPKVPSADQPDGDVAEGKQDTTKPKDREESLITELVMKNLCPGSKCARKITAHFPVYDFIDHALLIRRVQRLQPISETAFSIDCDLTYRCFERHREVPCDDDDCHEVEGSGYVNNARPATTAVMRAAADMMRAATARTIPATDPILQYQGGTAGEVRYIAIPLGLFPQQQSSNLTVTDHHGRAIRVATANDGASWTLQYMKQFWPKIFDDMPYDAQVALHHYIRSTRVPLALALMHIRSFHEGREWLDRHSKNDTKAMRGFVDYLKVISHQRLYFALVPFVKDREWTLNVRGQKTLNFGNVHIEMSWFEVAAQSDQHLKILGQLQTLNFESTSLDKAREFIDQNLRNNDFQENVEDIEQVIYQTSRNKLRLNFRLAAARLTGEILRCYAGQENRWKDSRKTLYLNQNGRHQFPEGVPHRINKNFFRDVSHPDFGFSFPNRHAQADPIPLTDLLLTVWHRRGLSHANINLYRCDNIFDWGWPQSDRYKVKVSDDTTIQSITRELEYPDCSDVFTPLKAYSTYREYVDDERVPPQADPDATTDECPEYINRRQYRLRPASRQHKDASFIYWHQGRKFFPEPRQGDEYDVDLTEATSNEDQSPGEEDTTSPGCSEPRAPKPSQRMFGRPHQFLFYMMPEKSLANSMALYTAMVVMAFIWAGVVIDARKMTVGVAMLTQGDGTSPFEVAAALLLAVSVSVIAFAGSTTIKDILRRVLRPLHHFTMLVMLSSWICLTFAFISRQSFDSQFVDPCIGCNLATAVTGLWLAVACVQTGFLIWHFRSIMFVVRPLRST